MGPTQDRKLWPMTASTVESVSQEPSNVVSEWLRTITPFVGSLSSWPDEIKAMMQTGADGILHEHRRRYDNTSSAGLHEVIFSELETYAQVSGAPLSTSVNEVIAVGGDRVACVLNQIRFGDGSSIEYLDVFLYGRTLQIERWVSFDVEDRSAAIRLVDELHAANPEPVFPGALDRAMAWFVELQGVARRAGVVPEGP